MISHYPSVQNSAYNRRTPPASCLVDRLGRDLERVLDGLRGCPADEPLPRRYASGRDGCRMVGVSGGDAAQTGVGCSFPLKACRCCPADPAAPGTVGDRRTTCERPGSFHLGVAGPANSIIALAAAFLARLWASERRGRLVSPRSFLLLIQALPRPARTRRRRPSAAPLRHDASPVIPIYVLRSPSRSRRVRARVTLSKHPTSCRGSCAEGRRSRSAIHSRWKGDDLY